jgi:hypothetical protein
MRAPKEVLTAFMAEFNAHTTENRYATYQRYLSKDGCPVVAFEINPADDYIYFENILSLQEEGKGYGSYALDWVCALADKHGVELRGRIQPPGGGRLDAVQLAAWYKRHGFRIEQSHICYEGRPKK